MRNTGYSDRFRCHDPIGNDCIQWLSDNEITPEGVDDGKFPDLNELLSASQWRERRTRQKGNSLMPISLFEAHARAT
jgi:hypothetical protein